ncbi:hypothetical protein Gotur_034944 [Gossypium turneri]
MFPMGGEWSLSEPRLPAKVVEDSKKNDEGIVIKMQNCPFHIKMQNCKLIKSISHYQVQLVFACFSYGLIIIFLQSYIWDDNEHLPLCQFALSGCPHNPFLFYNTSHGSQSHSSVFTMVNKCRYTVWPGVLSGAGTTQISPTGFILRRGESTSVSVPTSWSGRLWGQTLCTENSSGKFSCLTEDCGSSTLECSSSGASPPATLAEFTLNGAEEVDFYDVSLVDGYNLPMMVSPNGGTGGNRTLAFIGGAITILAAMRQLWHLF